MSDTDASARPRTDWAMWRSTFSETADTVRAGVEAVRETLEGATSRTAEECYLRAFGQAMDTVKFALAQLLTLRRELEGEPPDPSAELEGELAARGHTRVTLVRDEEGWWCESHLAMPYRNDPNSRAEAQRGDVTGPSLAAALRARLEDVLELQLAQANAEQIGAASRPASPDHVEAPEASDAVDTNQPTAPASPDAAADIPAEEIPF